MKLVAKVKIDRDGNFVQTREPEIPTFWLPAGTDVSFDIKIGGQRPAVEGTTVELLYGLKIRADF